MIRSVVKNVSKFSTLATSQAKLNTQSYFNLFDVSLRDGLQTWKEVVPTHKKLKMLSEIVAKHNPRYIEVGSIVSPKVLPQFHDSLKLYEFATMMYPDTDFYMLTPNLKAVKIAIENNVNNLSFISSVSNDFQQKNIKKTLDETKQELDLMFNEVEKSGQHIKNIKLYVSCINECPIAGPFKTPYIVDEIEFYYDNFKNLDKICLSDTCGTLNYNTFKDIVDKLERIVPTYKLSLHLHFSDFDNISNIIEYGYHKGIVDLDISYLENSGGCSVTIDSGKTHANLSYSILNEIQM
jgi:hydroxymethylglutaryl-CoA lyase